MACVVSGDQSVQSCPHDDSSENELHRPVLRIRSDAGPVLSAGAGHVWRAATVHERDRLSKHTDEFMEIHGFMRRSAAAQ
jgi:hypothetical protein